MKQKILSWILCLILLVNLLPAAAFATGAGITEAGGWNETLYAKISGIAKEDVTAVSYSGPMSGSLGAEDLEQLLRSTSDGLRLDILGLTAGSYRLTITTTSGELTQSDIVVPQQDRSGYAHFGATEGVGAYHNDGTLKENAIVLYVTEENKNTVTVTAKDGTTVTGIGNILNSVGMDSGNGYNSKGGLANTNQDILRKLAREGTPLVIRIIGRVTAPEGLTAYNSVDFGGSVGDNGFMARMSGGKNITIEGVGSGACLDGWGLHFICQTSDYQNGFGRSFEVRNLSFRNVPEDCVGMEGQQEENTLTAPVERCWIHHCAFYGPTISNPAESDKNGGDGACDFKRGQYFTNAYCYYEGYHKTNLVGGSDSNMQYHMTYHHNYWKNCESRGPLARQANIHMYNNIFENQSSYCMNPRADAYIFSEFNLFYQCKNPVTVKQGAVKSYGDHFSCCTGDQQATIVTDRNAPVTGNCKFAGFELDSTLSYIPGGDYILQESIPEMKAVVMANAGPQKEILQSAEDVDISVIPQDRYPKASMTVPYTGFFNNYSVPGKNGIYDNIVFHVSKTSADSITLGGGKEGCDMVFYVNQAVDISLTAQSATAQPALCSAAGEMLLVGTGTAENLPAGYYFIQSNMFDSGSGKYKEAKITSMTITAVNNDGPVDPDPTQPSDPSQPTDPQPTDPQPTDPKPGPDVVIPEGSYIHNFTKQGLESDFYTIRGNLSHTKGIVNFAGESLTQCLKIESSTSIQFQIAEAGQFTMVFGGNQDATGKQIKINGQKHTIGAGSILTLEVIPGSYTITKADVVNLFYMVYASESQLKPHIHEYVPSVKWEPSCDMEGAMEYRCVCGEFYTEPIAMIPHEYTAEIPEVDCREDGVAVYTCMNCGDTYTEIVPRAEHIYICERTEATCTELGVAVYTCEVCEESYTEEIPMIPHNYETTSHWENCEREGVMTHTCTACGGSYEETVPPIGHNHEKTTMEPGCITDGMLIYTCTTCGDIHTEVLPAVGHGYGVWETVKEPKPGESGLREKRCTVCGDVASEPIPGLPVLIEEEDMDLWIILGAGAGVALVMIIVVAILNKKNNA